MKITLYSIRAMAPVLLALALFALPGSAQAATNLYRSVGTTATNLNTSSRTVAISGSTATFSAAMPDNVGVGDVLVYSDGTNRLAFIHGRTSSTVFTVQDKVGAAPTAVSAGTSVTVFRAYTSLANWQSQTENANITEPAENDVNPSLNLVTADIVMMVACYGDGVDSTGVTIDGRTTDATRYIRIYTPVAASEVGASQRHAGVWDDNKYRLVSTRGTDLGQIQFADPYIEIDGLQVQLGAAAVADEYGFRISAGNCRISNTIIRGPATIRTWHCGIVIYQAGSGYLKLNNLIIYDFIGATSNYGFIHYDSIIDVYAYNLTFHNNAVGFSKSTASGTNVLKNSLFKSCTTAASGTFVAGTDYNATNNAAMGYTVTGGGNTHDRLSQTFTFVNEAGDDFHLAATDAGANRWGVDLSADANLAFSTDIDGGSRPSGDDTTWDIGADDVDGTLISVSGTAYDNTETTALTGTAYNVALRVNGGAASTTTTSTVDGTWSFASITAAAGDTLTIYFYGASDAAAGTYTGNVVTITDGSTNITGVSLIDDHVVLRSDNGATAITIPDLWDYDNTQNAANLLFDAVDAAPDTLSVESGNELYVTATDTFTPGGNVTVTSSGIDIRGTWTATGTESLTLGTGTWNVDTAGAFIAASSTVTFGNTFNQITVISGGTDDNHDFNNVIIGITNTSNDFNVVTNDMDIDGNLTMSGGLFSPTTNVYLAGNLTIDDAAAVGVENDTGDLIFDGTGLQTITNAVGETEAVAEVQISNSSASGVRMDNAVPFQDFVMNANAKFDCNGYDLTIGYLTTTWTVAPTAIFITGANTVTFSTAYHPVTVTTGGTDDNHDFNNVVIAIGNAFNDFNVVTNDMDIDGNLTMSGGHFSPTTNVYLAGNLTIDDAANVAAENDTGDLIFDDAGLQTITNAVGETEAVAEVQISNTSASGVKLNDAVTVTSTAINTNALLNLNGKNYTTATAFTNSGTLQLTGDETVTTPTNNAGSTVEYTATTGSRAIKDWTYQSLKINGAGGTFTMGAGEVLGEHLTVTAGTLDAGIQTLAINGNTTINGGTFKTGTNTITFGNAAGDTVTISSGELQIQSDSTTVDIVKTAGTWTNSGGTITCNCATGVSTSLLSALSAYNHLTVNSTESTYTLNGTITVNGNLTITAGTLDVNSVTGYDINVGGNWTNSTGAFTPRGKTVTFNGAGTQTLISGGTGTGKTFTNVVKSNSSTVNFSTNDVYAGGTVTVSGGTLATKGYELTSVGNLTVSSGTLDATDTGGEGDTSYIYVGGSVDLTGGNFTPATSTIVQNGTGSTTFTSATKSVNNLIINDGLVGYWKLDETSGGTFADASGYGNNGTGAGAAGAQNTPQPSTTVPTLLFTDARSLNFDGTDDYITTNQNVGISGKTAIVSMWFKTPTVSAYATKVIFELSPNFNSYDAFIITFNDNSGGAPPIMGGILAAMHSAAGYSLFGTNSRYDDNTWHHLEVVFDRNQAAAVDQTSIYIDGAKVAMSVVGGYNAVHTTSFTNNKVYIGARSGASYPFFGLLDDVRVYNRALSAAEIAALANGTHPASAASGSKVTLEDTLDVNGSLTINSGDLDNKALEDNAITVAGSWWNNGGKFTNDGGTVTFDGTSGTNYIQAGNEDFYNLSVAGSGGTWNLNQSVMVTSNLSHTAGSIGTNGYDFMITGDLTFAATVDLSSGTHSVMGSVNLTGATITPGTSTLVFNPSSGAKTLTEANKALNNVLVTSKEGLVGWWKMDGGTSGSIANNTTTGLEDASGSGNNGTASNANGTGMAWAPGKLSGAVSFDGVDDYVNAGSAASTDDIQTQGGGGLSVVGWIKPNAGASTIVSKGIGASFSGCWYVNFQFDNRIMFSKEGSTDLYARSSPVWTLGNWQQFAVVWDGTVTAANVGLYRNGLAVTHDLNTDLVGPASDASLNLSIGGYTNGASLFNGLIDDIRVYNRALTPEEITALYRGHPLSATGTITLQDTMDVNGNMVLGDGTFAAGANTIKVAKNWTNSDATFTYNTSTVDFDDDTQANTISGSTTFYNLKIDSATAKTVTFQSGKTQTIAAGGALTLTGAASQLLTLAPGTAATTWLLTHSGATQSVSYVSPSYSNAGGGATIQASNSTNGGNNTNWNFGTDADTSGEFLTFF